MLRSVNRITNVVDDGKKFVATLKYDLTKWYIYMSFGVLHLPKVILKALHYTHPTSIEQLGYTLTCWPHFIVGVRIPVDLKILKLIINGYNE